MKRRIYFSLNLQNIDYRHVAAPELPKEGLTRKIFQNKNLALPGIGPGCHPVLANDLRCIMHALIVRFWY